MLCCRILCAALGVCGFMFPPHEFLAKGEQSVTAEPVTAVGLADTEVLDTEARARIVINAAGKQFTYEDEKIIPSDFTVAEYIETHEINSPIERKIEFVDGLMRKGADYKTALSVCFPRLPSVVDEVKGALFVPAVDAQVEYKNGIYNVTKESAGAKLDENRLYAGIYYCFKFGGDSVRANAVVVPPEVTQGELKRNIILRGAYTTEYSTSTESRAHNVSLALSKFDGLKIAAGETLSFNATVGARTEENGFRKAKIIVDGKYVDGVGGGVCQASTALYNAALLAGLSCSANAHSICPSYCPAGLDAMISTSSDLKVTNTTDHDIYIAVKFAGAKATVRMFGEKNEFDITPESVVLETRPFKDVEVVDGERKYFGEDAVSGDRLLVSLGKDGVVSETYLKYYKDGQFVKRVKIRQNEYKASPQIVAVAP